MSPDVPGLYRVLLRLYPPAWREEYGEEMAEVFARRHAEASRGGVLGRTRLWSRESVAAVRIGLGARVSADASGPDRPGLGVGWLSELRYAARRLRRGPAFTAATVLTLALAIAANVSIFTLVRRVVLKPLPYDEPGALLNLEHELPGLGPGSVGVTESLYVLYDGARSLEEMAIYQLVTRTFSNGGDPERLRAALTTAELDRVLRVSPAQGRWFDAADTVPGAGAGVVISHRLWQRVFGAGDAIGEPVTIEGVSVPVLGVMPESFAFPDPRVDLWMLASIDRADPAVGGFNYLGIGRMAGGATVESVRGELDGLIATLPALYPGETATAIIETGRLIAAPRTLKEATVGGVRATLWVLLGSVAIVLLVACANIANLVLARSESRQREMAVRRALGSGRRGLVAYVFAEAAVLAAAGGVLGTLAGAAGLRALLASAAVPLPRLHEVRFDGSVLAFAIALTVLAALAFTVIPLARRTPVLSLALREAGRGSSLSRGGVRVRHVLIGAQVALALILLTAGGLLVRSHATLRAVDPGFDPSSTLTFRIGLPATEYPSGEPARAAAAQRDLLARLSALPGVRSAAATTCLPLDGFCFGDPLSVRGAELEPGEIPPIVTMRRVSAGYFAAMGMRFLAGSGFGEGDIAAGARPAVISRRLADLYFPGDDPIGQLVHPGFRAEDPAWYTVVGIVADMPTNSMRESTPVPSVYFPVNGEPEPGPGLNGIAFVVRTDVPPLSLASPVRAAVRAFDAGLAVASVRTLESALEEDGARMAFTMTLLLLAAGVALALGVVGISGVIAYLVGQRTREIGLRMVLGARPGEIAGLIVRQTGVAAGLGMAVGLAVAFSSGRFIESLLFRVEARDPVTYGAVVVLLAGIVLVACWVPARRAARLDPASALRT